jgi:hypothetical protein
MVFREFVVYMFLFLHTTNVTLRRGMNIQNDDITLATS